MRSRVRKVGRKQGGVAKRGRVNVEQKKRVAGEAFRTGNRSLKFFASGAPLDYRVRR